ncbi:MULTISPECIES: hypothetical protein [Bradyrhizobium]|nr:hypothetical protein QIH91_22250 [Bradyrhizobium japonicum USDA 135]
MSDHKFEISFWGIKISAPGPAGISAAVLAVELWRNLGDDGVRKAAYRGG